MFFLPNLPGNRHLNFIMGALIEISAYFVEFFMFTKYGRKFPMIGYEILNGAVCLIIAIITVYKTPESTILSKCINKNNSNPFALINGHTKRDKKRPSIKYLARL